MSFFFAIALAASTAPIFPKERCIDPKTDEDHDMCEWLDMMGLEELRTVESLGVGVGDEIYVLREQAKSCKLTYRVDYVGSRAAVVDILNADDEGKTCFLSWIRSKAPNLEFSDERLNELIQNQPSPDEALQK